MKQCKKYKEMEITGFKKPKKNFHSEICHEIIVLCKQASQRRFFDQRFYLLQENTTNEGPEPLYSVYICGCYWSVQIDNISSVFIIWGYMAATCIYY
jgi:hypothetical protein